ncbi:MAG TPA: sensor histidine kinase [Streptosporangiaceae bacterium]|nr:sensor histidine kinase [Streptosporangiaceae bacterium]
MGDGERPLPAPAPGARPATWPARAGGTGLAHLAFLYRGANEYLELMLAFIREGLDRAEPVFAALPGHLGWRVQADLGAAGRQLAVADISELGRNPARITLALWTFADQHARQQIRVVTEPLWPGRTDAEAAEVMKHEALIQLAVGTVGGQILCAYDADQLSRACIDGACHAHPEILERGRRRPSGEYRADAGWLREVDLPAPPAWADFIAYRSELHSVRELARRYGERAGLPGSRCADLILAVGEITANTLAHTAGGGTAHIWTSGHEVVCQIHDGGRITDPLAGRKRPPPDSPGQGLWVVNQVCDLVETRTGPAGTTTRLHIRLPGS